MNNIVEFFGHHALMLLIAVTCLLAAGAGAILCIRSPILRQRIAQGTVTMVLLWLPLACLPLPRLSLFRFLDANDAPVRRSESEQPDPSPPADNIAYSSSLPDLEAYVEPPVEAEPSPDNTFLNENLFSTDEEFEDGTASPFDSALIPLPIDFPPSHRQQPNANTAHAPIATTPFDPAAGLTFAYLIGASLFVCWLLLGRFLLSRMVRVSKQAQPWAAELLQSICEENNIRQPRLLVSARCRRPVSFGLFRPTILLPPAICKRGRSEQLRHVLLHELGHVRQRDAWGCALFSAVLPLLYFHPLYWWLRRQNDLSAELVADDWAAARSSRVGYVDALLELFKQHGRSEMPSWGTLGVFHSSSQFTRRMEMLLQRTNRLATRCSWFWRTSLAMLLLCVVAAAAALWGIGQPASAQQKTSVEDESKAEEAPDGVAPKTLDADLDKAKTVKAPVSRPPKVQQNSPSTPLKDSNFKPTVAPAEDAPQTPQYVPTGAGITYKLEIREVFVTLPDGNLERRTVQVPVAVRTTKKGGRTITKTVPAGQPQYYSAPEKAPAPTTKNKYGLVFSMKSKFLEVVNLKTRETVLELPLDEFSEVGIFDEKVTVYRNREFQATIDLKAGTVTKPATTTFPNHAPGTRVDSNSKPAYNSQPPKVNAPATSTHGKPKRAPRTTQSKTAPKNLPAAGLSSSQPANRQIDLIQLATAYADAQNALETVQLDLERNQQAAKKNPGAIPQRTMALGELKVKSATRKVQLLGKIAESALSIANQERKILQQQIKRIQQLQKSGAIGPGTLLQVENQLHQIEGKLDILQLILKN